MIKIRIMWQDLNDQFKERLLKVFDCNMNWDVVPMSVLEIDDGKEEETVLDSLLGDIINK